jgi:hypothetical protein
MRGIPALALAIPLALHSQRLSGIVVDADGKTIDGVRIDHATQRGFGEKTSDHDGHYSIETNGHAVVFRKSGYHGELVRASSKTGLRVVLQHATRDFPTCKTLRDFEGIVDGAPGLYFPMVAGVSVDGRGMDIDYATRLYSVKTEAGSKAIQHGRGPMWSFGIPVSSDVWGSTEYSDTSYPEASFMQGHVVILDARGKSADGKFWRYLGMLGESASYRNVDEVTGRILDKVIDGACLQTKSVNRDDR